MDVINLHNNENDATKDSSLAFIYHKAEVMFQRLKIFGTSCALSSVQLWSNYSGNLEILLNVPIVCRSIVILLILGTTPGKTYGGRYPLHSWCFVFMPVEYYITISAIITVLMKDG